jgi:predicted dehydrogenase
VVNRLAEGERIMAERLRIGIIGCGRILPAHLRGYRLLREAGFDDFRITALVARRPEDAHMFRRRGEGPPPRPSVSHNPGDPLSAPHIYVSDFQPDVDAQVYASVEAMLAADVVDAVDITATLPVHHTAGLACLAAGKHALIQKPLAVSVRAGQRLLDAAAERGLTLGVTENVRYVEAVRTAGWLIERGELGTPQMVASVSIGTLEWSPDKAVADTPWRHHKVIAGGGASLDIGVHIAHRLRYLLGEVRTMTAVARVFEPRRRRLGPQGEVLESFDCDADDAFFALPEFESGAIGNISFTWAGHGEPIALPDGLSIYGSRGCLKGATLIRDGGQRQSARELFEREAEAAVKQRFYPLGLTDTFALGFYDFMTAIRRGEQPEASGLEGLRDLATAFAIMESATAGGPVKVADVLAGRIDAYQQEINAYHRL